MPESITTRNPYRSSTGDLAKGILICLVTIGHIIQYGLSSKQSYLEDPLFVLVYMFHMPAFMFIGGYFSRSAWERSGTMVFLNNRWRSALLPGIFWATPSIVYSLIRIHSQNAWDAVIFGIQRVQSLWFLWSVLVCSIICAGLAAATRRKAAFIPGIIFIMLLPDGTFGWLHGLKLTKFALPFFAAGFFQQELRLRALSGRRWLVCLAVICMLWLGFQWTPEHFAYISGSDIFKMRPLLLAQRLLAGFLGTFIFLSLVKFKGGWLNLRLAVIGRSSLGIYILQMQIFITMSHLGPGLDLGASSMGKWAIAILSGMVLTDLLERLSSLLSRFAWFSRVALGSR